MQTDATVSLKHDEAPSSVFERLLCERSQRLRKEAHRHRIVDDIVVIRVAVGEVLKIFLVGCFILLAEP